MITYDIKHIALIYGGVYEFNEICIAAILSCWQCTTLVIIHLIAYITKSVWFAVGNVTTIL